MSSHKLRSIYTSKSNSKELDTINPPAPKFTEARQLEKQCSVRKCQTMYRFFVIDDDNLSYYTTVAATRPKKILTLNGA